ncbi:MAG: hypothetical protein QF376_04380 [Anaerolineales bacterium]|jgi:hypothetical protein|nr:hypothetical protein [Anaerolineales bacterium]HJO33768.1 hypothetical protein [Anaerolineales bacterium]|tara:strand:- start:403 stop:804 length:402 start_codon:yes stop_codon:yes gene_type:complete
MGAIALPHSVLSWLALLAGAATALKFALASHRHGGITSADRTLMVTFVGVMDVQAVLGVAVFLGNDEGLAAAFESTLDMLSHASLMLFALLAAHAAAHWSKPPAKLRHTLAATVLALLFVLAGMLALSQGWFG